MDERVAALVREVLAGLELAWTERSPGLFAVTLPGTAKLSTECALEVGRYGVGVRAFVCRRPDENAEGVLRWLLQRNLRLVTVAFGLDALGDIYLTGTLPLDTVTAAVLDRVLGEVTQTADGSFNTLLELGFAGSIAREWAWRRSRGEPTGNLAAFTHLDPGPPSPGRTQAPRSEPADEPGPEPVAGPRPEPVDGSGRSEGRAIRVLRDPEVPSGAASGP